MIPRAICALAAMLAATLAVPMQDAAAQDLDVDAWVGLAQMPVAVARLEIAGVPQNELGMLVTALNRDDVSPNRFLETVWAIPVLWGDDANGYGGAQDEGVGTYVQAMHERGLRGRELADAIHAELNRRGVPAGGARRDALDPDYLPDAWVDGRFRDDPLFEISVGDDGRRGPRARVFRDRGRDGARGRGVPAVRRGEGGQGQGAKGQGGSPPGLDPDRERGGGPPQAGGKGRRGGGNGGGNGHGNGGGGA